MPVKRTKKLISLLLAVLLTVTLFPAAGLRAAALSRGDVDGDGKVTSGDARLCLRCSVNLEKYAKGSARYNACDYDGDGKVTSADARLILRASVGLKDDTPAQQKFKVPMSVYKNGDLEITLTGYETKYDREREEMVTLCTFTIKNSGVVPYDPFISGVAVNGLQIAEPMVSGKQIHPVSQVNMQVLIPSRYFDISQAGNAMIDELLVHFDFRDVSTRKWQLANVALYPTNKKPGAAVRYAADSIKFKKKKETDDVIFGIQNATYHWQTKNNVQLVDYVDALYYVKNKSDRDLYVYLYDISLNDSIKVDYELSVYVFAGTVAEPEIYIDPNFFAWHNVSDIRELAYTLAVYDAASDTLLFTDNRSLTWS